MVHAHAHHDHKIVLEERNVEEGDLEKRDSQGHVVTVIYVTASATFDGPIGGYVTGSDPATTKAAQGVGAPVGQTRTSEKKEEEATTTADPKTKATVKTHATLTKETEPTGTAAKVPQEITTDKNAKAVPTTFSTATSDSTSSLTIPGLEHSSTTRGSSSSDHSASASVSAIPSGSDSGLTGGAKAGIAIGVILGVGLIAGFIFFFMRKRKQGRQLAEGEAANEKAFAASNLPPPGPPPKHTPMTPSEPPQLNVRPITQFAPDLTPTGGGMAGLSAANAGAGATLTVAAAGSRNLTGNPSPPHTPQSSVGKIDPFSDPVNPFGNQAEASSPVAAPSPVSPSIASGPQTPQITIEPAPSEQVAESAMGVNATAGAVVAGAAVAGAAAAAVSAAASTAKSSDAKTLPSRPESLSSQASSILEGSTQSPVSAVNADTAPPTSAGAIAAVPAFGPGGPDGAGPAPGASNVHRVQMDFKPSMEDELELHAGQLVRLVHEYDDGWALCVKLDRSQQGVAPRSCLSARPVKPRARPPPGPGAGPGPSPRGPPPMMGPNTPRGPPGPGPMGPPGPRFYPQDPHPRSPSRPRSPARPMSPARPPHAGPPPPRPYQPRSMSPAQYPPGPRSFSPGPGARPMPPRSMSPGPYGPPGLQRPEMPAANQRKRSNSASGAVGPISRSGESPGPSPLAGPMMPPPSGALPAIPTPPLVPAPHAISDDFV